MQRCIARTGNSCTQLLGHKRERWDLDLLPIRVPQRLIKVGQPGPREVTVPIDFFL